MVLIPDIFGNALWAALEWQEERHPPGVSYPSRLAQFYSFLYNVTVVAVKNQIPLQTLPGVTCASNFIQLNDKVCHFSHILPSIYSY